VTRVRVAMVLGGAAIVAMGLVACGGARRATKCRLTSVDESSYVAKNEALLQEIPIFPDSKLVNSGTDPQPAPDACLPTENGPPFSRFMTTRVYATPKPIPHGAVVRYYRARLVPRWRLLGWASPDRDSTFRRGASTLYVAETGGLPGGRGSWSITVDHAAYRSSKG
jgi:hypothetical protein